MNYQHQADEKAAYANHKQAESRQAIAHQEKKHREQEEYASLVNRAQARLRCNLCRYPERSVRKAMLKEFPNMVSIQQDANYAYEVTLSPFDNKYCIDGIILEAVKQNNALYGSGSKSIRGLREYDRSLGDRYVDINR